MTKAVWGAEAGVVGIPQWFQQFPGFSYRPSKTVIDEFIRLAWHLSLPPNEDEYQAYFKSLAGVVALGTSAYPVKSGCRAFAEPFFRQFEGFNYRPSKPVVSEFHRLATDPRWPTIWKKKVPGKRPISKMRAFIEKSMEEALVERNISAYHFPASRYPKPTGAIGYDRPGNSDGTALNLSQELDNPHLLENLVLGSKKYRKKRTELLTSAFENEFDQVTDMMVHDEEVEDSDSGVEIGGVSKLAQWQAICGEVGIEPIPTSVTRCRKAMKKVHINLVDLVEARHINRDKHTDLVAVRKFESAAALARYIRRTGKVFPKNVAKKDGALKALLRTVFQVVEVD